jgi:hypothetical protein
MTAKKPNGTSLDELLKNAFADDLPPDVAAGMRDRLDRFRAGTMREERRMSAWAWVFRRSAWAAVSILMIVSGSLLQGLGSRNPLADRISLIGTQQAVSGQLAAAESMSCSARVRNEGGEFLDLEIVWRSGSAGEVRVSAPDGSSHRSFILGEPGENADPLARVAASFSSPNAVWNLLSGGWRLVKFSGEAGRDTGTFITPSGTGSEVLEFMIDLGTYFPVRITQMDGESSASGGTGNILWQARLTF